MRRLVAVVGLALACSPMSPQTDGGAGGGSAGGASGGGASAGGTSGGGAASGGSAAGGAASGGSAAGGAAAGGAASGGSAAGGSTAGGSAGGATTDGGIAADCDAWGASAAHLRTVLMNCSNPSDSSIYGFDRVKCLMQAQTACTPTERATLSRIAACDLQVAACATAADRSTAVGAINACASGSMLSSGCISSFQ